jgi:hypothetical protein
MVADYLGRGRGMARRDGGMSDERGREISLFAGRPVHPAKSERDGEERAGAKREEKVDLLRSK